MKTKFECLNNVDVFGFAEMFTDDGTCGVDYNLCIENGQNLSAIYYMTINNKTECYDINYDLFIHYEIDFGNENWKEKLEEKMKEALERFMFLDGKNNIVYKENIEEETIEFDTYPETVVDWDYNVENPFYDTTIIVFSVTKKYAEEYVKEKFEMTLEEFNTEYTWDDTWNMYIDAQERKELIKVNVCTH